MKTRTVLMIMVGMFLVLSVSACAPVGKGSSGQATQEVDFETLADQPPYETNEDGLTYGSMSGVMKYVTDESGMYEEEEFYAQCPDLISVSTTEHLDGFVYKEELLGDGTFPSTPEEAIEASKGSSAREIDVYSVDGKTVIGKYKIDG